MACIAVVNDDTTFLDLMSQLLELEGHATVILREGHAAFEALVELMPDLIILDIRMDKPETGWFVCEMLTLDPRTRAIPIIVCSAALPDLRERVGWLTSHGIGALAKPFDIDDLYECVRIALQTGRPIVKGV